MYKTARPYGFSMYTKCCVINFWSIESTELVLATARHLTLYLTTLWEGRGFSETSAVECLEYRNSMFTLCLGLPLLRTYIHTHHWCLLYTVISSQKWPVSLAVGHMTQRDVIFVVVVACLILHRKWYGTFCVDHIPGSPCVLIIIYTSFALSIWNCFDLLLVFHANSYPLMHDCVQMIGRIEFVHNKNFIHRDIKPDNFLMGIGRHCNKVHMQYLHT